MASFVSGPKAPRRGSVYDGLMHISDWYPTILSAAGLKTPRGLNLDGHNQWPAITGKRRQSPRKVINWWSQSIFTTFIKHLTFNAQVAWVCQCPYTYTCQNRLLLAKRQRWTFDLIWVWVVQTLSTFIIFSPDLQSCVCMVWLAFAWKLVTWP